MYLPILKSRRIFYIAHNIFYFVLFIFIKISYKCYFFFHISSFSCQSIKLVLSLFSNTSTKCLALSCIIFDNISSAVTLKLCFECFWNLNVSRFFSFLFVFYSNMFQLTFDLDKLLFVSLLLYSLCIFLLPKVKLFQNFLILIFCIIQIFPNF